MDEKEKEKLFFEMEQASKAIKAVNKGQGTETKYGLAYQALVKAGLAPQLKRKYRVI
jgi:hypothetical protein